MSVDDASTVDPRTNDKHAGGRHGVGDPDESASRPRRTAAYLSMQRTMDDLS